MRRAARKPAQGAGRESPEQLLRRAFIRNGNLRRPDREPSPAQGRRAPSSNYEVRFAAYDLDECHELQRLLELAGIEIGPVYQKRYLYVLPVRGRKRVLDAIRRLKLRKRPGDSRRERLRNPRKRRPPVNPDRRPW